MSTKLEGDSIIKLERVSVVYETRRGRVLAVEDLNLDVPRGGFVSVIGPSGCGKSTMLNLIAGFLYPTSGHVLINGEPIRGPGSDRAVVHQQTGALLPWLNTEENVAIALRVAGVPRKARLVTANQYLDLVGLGGFGKHAIYELSGGMQQRVAVARALAAESQIVLMDEPLAALDALQREVMQDFLLDIWAKTKRTFFMITHSVEEAVYLGSKVVAMSARPGRILFARRLTFGETALAKSGVQVKQTSEFVRVQGELLAKLTR